MSLALNLNNQIEHIPRNQIIFKKRSWKKGFIAAVIMTMIVISPIFFAYLLTNPPAKGMTLEQYASSPLPTPPAKDYLGS